MTLHTTSEFQSNARSLIVEMLNNQRHLNQTAYSTEWFEKGKSREFHYPVAASQEIAEFINSYWLPWWSKAEQDLVNCRIEIVDALHFMLSQTIIDFHGNVEDAADYILDSLNSSFELQGEINTLEAARNLQASLSADIVELVYIDLFLLSYSMNFDIDKLHALYMGKSILNKFRQDNGYRQGTYKKKWDGVNEDNHFMAKWISEQDEKVTGATVLNFLTTEYAKYSNGSN